MILQLNPIFWVDTPLGSGYAIILNVNDHDNYWTVALDNGALVTFSQERIRMTRCYTHQRGITDEEMMNIVGKKRGEGT